MALQELDLIVIGGGPAGYTGAIRAAQLGMRVALCEEQPQLGGTCLRVGCIPSKALLESSARYEQVRSHVASHGIRVGEVSLDLPAMMGRKQGVVDELAQGVQGLLKKHGIVHVKGRGRLARATSEGTEVEVTLSDGKGIEQLVGRSVLLAPGSIETPMRNVNIDGKQVVTSTEALSFDKVPASLVVIGAGAIGLELGSVWRRLGAKVTVLEYADRILPTMDAELAQAAHKVLAKQGLDIRTGTEVTGVKVGKKAVEVTVAGKPALSCERVLVAVGRRPNTADLGLDRLGIALDARGRIDIDAHYATSAKGVYAVGDAVVGPSLAHKAEEEAVACVERMASGYGHVCYEGIAYIVYTEPEIASVGETEEALKASNVAYRKGSFPFVANGRARAVGATEGFAKILVDAHTDRILGAHIVGAHAGDLIQEIATAIHFAASSEDIARSCHAHPTLGEAVREAALSVHGRTLNL